LTQAPLTQEVPVEHMLLHTGVVPEVSHISHALHAGLHLTTAGAAHLLFWQEVPAAQLSTHTGVAPEVSHVWHALHGVAQVGGLVVLSFSSSEHPVSPMSRAHATLSSARYICLPPGGGSARALQRARAISVRFLGTAGSNTRANYQKKWDLNKLLYFKRICGL